MVLGNLNNKIVLISVFTILVSCIKLVNEQGGEYSQIEIDFDRHINHKTENLIIVTLDGYRWQEVFKGADSSLLFVDSLNTTSLEDRIDKYWAATAGERREKLMPFFWNIIAAKGKLYGNRDFGVNVNVANRTWNSYPGYNEIFSGYPDPDYRSNERIMNPNINIFDILNDIPEYENRMGIFTRGGGFPFIFNNERNGIQMFSGAITAEAMANTASVEIALSSLESDYTFHDDSGYKSTIDRLVYVNAKDFLVKHRPKVLYISFLNTDAFGHQNKYDKYLASAYNISVYIEDLWNYIQQDSLYKDKTTLFITTDHGRGIGPEWQYHSSAIAHSDETWCVLIGPDTQALGEIKKKSQIYQKQYAKSFLAFLGFETFNNPNIGSRVIEFMDAK